MKEHKSINRIKSRKPESYVVKACMDWLLSHHVYAWRNNTGAYKTDNGSYVRYGKPGSADILGVTKDGKFLAIECKAPKGKQTDLQRDFGRNIKLNGGVYILANGVEELEKFKTLILGVKNAKT